MATSSSSGSFYTPLFHSWPWSLSQFTMPGHTKTSLHMKSCLPNPCLLFLVAPQLTTAGLSSGGEGFSAISWFGGDAQRLSQPFFSTNPSPPALEHNWAAPIAEDIPVVHPKQSEIGLLRASDAQAHQSELNTSHRVKTENYNPQNWTVLGRTDSYQSWAFPPSFEIPDYQISHAGAS